MDFDALAELLQSGQIDEATLNQLLESGMFDQTEDLYEKQMGVANALRSTPSPEMRQAGGVSVAANPLEFAAAALQRNKGEEDLEALMGKNEGLIQSQKDSVKALIAALSRGKQQPIAQGQPVGLNPWRA